MGSGGPEERFKRACDPLQACLNAGVEGTDVGPQDAATALHPGIRFNAHGAANAAFVRQGLQPGFQRPRIVWVKPKFQAPRAPKPQQQRLYDRFHQLRSAFHRLADDLFGGRDSDREHFTTRLREHPVTRSGKTRLHLKGLLDCCGCRLGSDRGEDSGRISTRLRDDLPGLCLGFTKHSVGLGFGARHTSRQHVAVVLVRDNHPRHRPLSAIFMSTQRKPRSTRYPGLVGGALASQACPSLRSETGARMAKARGVIGTHGLAIVRPMRREMS